MAWHDERANELDRSANELAANGGAGSIQHWNLVNDAARSRDQARWDAGSAQPPMAAYQPQAGAGYAGAHGGGMSFGEVFGPLLKWSLILAAALALLWAAFGAVVAIDNQWLAGRSGGGLGRFAAARVFPGESLSPASRYAADPDTGKAFPAGSARLIESQAYACQLQIKCAESPKANMLRAANMLALRTKAGDEIAARDLCLMPLLAGSGGETIETARFYCAAALRNRPDSAEARRMSSSLNHSPVMWAVRLAQRVKAWDPAR